MEATEIVHPAPAGLPPLGKSEWVPAFLARVCVWGGGQDRPVHYTGPENNLLDEDKRGVMMSWEDPLMKAHAEILAHSGGDVLNVGFGSESSPCLLVLGPDRAPRR